VTPSDAPLLRVWREPSRALQLDGPGWTEFLQHARRAAVLGRLGALLRDEGLLDRIPPKAAAHLRSGLVVAAHAERVISWEVRQLERVLGSLDSDLVLLKGAAYLVGGLRVARGRMCSDVDILVPREHLDAVEKMLLASGWAQVMLEPYDQLYYRRWTHELPPLVHRERLTAVDVHHGILPVTSRLKPDPVGLLAQTRALPEPWSRWKVLSSEHMVLHAAAHGFHDGELQEPLRDILDIHQLVSEFAEGDPAFGERLWSEAASLGLERPLHYALRYAGCELGTAVAQSPPTTVRPVLQRAMDACVHRALRSHESPSRDARTWAASWLLYLRSHWLRMPPGLLARHLATKALRTREALHQPSAGQHE